MIGRFRIRPEHLRIGSGPVRTFARDEPRMVFGRFFPLDPNLIIRGGPNQKRVDPNLPAPKLEGFQPDRKILDRTRSARLHKTNCSHGHQFVMVTTGHKKIMVTTN